MNKRRILFLVLLTLAAVAVFVTSENVTHYLMAQSAVVPYTIEMNLYDLTGPAERLEYPTVSARRSDGTQVRMGYSGPLSWGQVTRQIHYADGRSTSLFDKLKVKTQFIPVKLTDLKTQAHYRAMDAGPCEAVTKHTKKLRDDSFLGHKATVVLDAAAEARGLRVTHWRAPALGCVSLKYTVERLRKDDKWIVTYEGRATSVRIGEPDPRLFEESNYPPVTEGYTEQVFSDMAAKEK